MPSLPRQAQTRANSALPSSGQWVKCISYTTMNDLQNKHTHTHTHTHTLRTYPNACTHRNSTTPLMCGTRVLGVPARIGCRRPHTLSSPAKLHNAATCCSSIVHFRQAIAGPSDALRCVMTSSAVRPHLMSERNSARCCSSDGPRLPPRALMTSVGALSGLLSAAPCPSKPPRISCKTLLH